MPMRAPSRALSPMHRGVSDRAAASGTREVIFSSGSPRIRDDDFRKDACMRESLAAARIGWFPAIIARMRKYSVVLRCTVLRGMMVSLLGRGSLVDG